MTEAPPRLARGIAWFVGGSAILIATLWLRVAAQEPAGRYLPIVALVMGAYAVVVGVERLVAALKAGPAGPVRIGGVALLVAAVAIGGWTVHRARAPYWNDVALLAAGDEATAKLRTLAERTAARLQAARDGPEALAAWRDAAAEGLPLRPAFAASVKAARRLGAATAGRLRAKAEIDERFYSLCLEWMDLYERVQRTLSEESMTAPPDTWERTQDDIVERIQELPPVSGPGA